jgi:hypothetical protein
MFISSQAGIPDPVHSTGHLEALRDDNVTA